MIPPLSALIWVLFQPPVAAPGDNSRLRSNRKLPRVENEQGVTARSSNTTTATGCSNGRHDSGLLGRSGFR